MFNMNELSPIEAKPEAEASLQKKSYLKIAERASRLNGFIQAAIQKEWADETINTFAACLSTQVSILYNCAQMLEMKGFISKDDSQVIAAEVEEFQKLRNGLSERFPMKADIPPQEVQDEFIERLQVIADHILEKTDRLEELF